MTVYNKLNPIEFQGRLIVHVGTHKTGTTSIQGTLDANYELLRDNFILYPKAGRSDGNHSGSRLRTLDHPLVRSLIGEHDQHASTYVEALRNEIHEAAPTTVILSSEVLSREYLSSQVFCDIQRLFPKASRTWIIYLRRQDQLVVSRYAEGIKIGRLAWADSIRHALQPIILDHRLKLERLRYAVGQDTIVPVSFDATKTRLIAGFFEAIDQKMTSALPKAQHANTSRPWGTLQLLRLANSMPRFAKHFTRRAVFTLNGRVSNTRARWILNWPGPLSPQQAEDIRKKYEASNHWVEDTFWGGRRYLTGCVQDYRKKLVQVTE